MDFFDFSCPYCQQELSISTELKGKFFKCPNCGKEILMEFQNKVQFPTENKEKRKQNAESEKPDFIYEEIKQLKTEATRQNEFSNMLLKELKRTNRTLNLFILFSVFIMIVILALVHYNFRDIHNDIKRFSDTPTDHKIISYTWENFYEMEAEVKKALNSGYSPAGFMCNNSIKGGFFLFVRRK